MCTPSTSDKRCAPRRPRCGRRGYSGVVLRGGEQQLLPHMEHRAHLQSHRGHRFPVHEYAVGVVADAHVHQSAFRGPRGNAGDDLHRALVLLVAQQAGRSAPRVERVDLQTSLVPRLPRSAAVPPPTSARPRDTPNRRAARPPCCRRARGRQRHRRVACARGGIGDGGGGRIRVGWIGDGPRGHPGVVGALHQQGLPVGRPPVAACPVQLLWRR